MIAAPSSRKVSASSSARTWLVARKFSVVFSLAFLLSFVGGYTAFHLIRLLLRVGVTDNASPSPIEYMVRMPMYPDLYPLQYAAIVAVPFALLTALWTLFGSKSIALPRWLQVIVLIMVALPVSSMLAGMLYVFHDMQAGYFPAYGAMIDYLQWGAWSGLVLGPLILAESVPLNIALFVLAYLVASVVERRYAR